MPLASFEGSPWAKTSASFDTEPLEIHVLRPRRTHESPSRFALVRIFVASLPTSGSVRPKHPRTSPLDRKSTRLNSSHLVISYAVFCLKKKKKKCISAGIHKLKTMLYKLIHCTIV